MLQQHFHEFSQRTTQQTHHQAIRRAYTSSDLHLLLDSLLEKYLLAFPPLQKKWILVPHLSLKGWLEKEILRKVGTLTSYSITTPEAFVSSFSNLQQSTLSPSELALLITSFDSLTQAFFGNTDLPLYQEFQKLGKLLHELSFMDEELINPLLKTHPSLYSLYREIYSPHSPFAPWIRKWKSSLLLQTPISLFQVTDLSPHFLSHFEGDLFWFCLEPSGDFWADELVRGIAPHLPPFFLYFGEVRKSRMKQFIDFDFEIHPCEEEIPSTNTLDIVRKGCATIDPLRVAEGLQEALASGSLQITMLGTPLEEAHFVASIIAQKIGKITEEDPYTYLQAARTILDDTLIITPAGKSYHALLEMEFARLAPKIPVYFEGIIRTKEEIITQYWLQLLSPTNEGKISSLITSDSFFEFFELDIKERPYLESLFSFVKEKEQSFSIQNTASLQNRITLIEETIEFLEHHLFSRGSGNLIEEFLRKLLCLSHSLKPWLDLLREGKLLTLSEAHALLTQTASYFFEDDLMFVSPFLPILEKSALQWNTPIEVRWLLHFCTTSRIYAGEHHALQGLLKVRPFSPSCISPAKSIFLLGMGHEYGGPRESSFASILPKERSKAKIPIPLLERDTLFDLFLMAKEELIITSSSEKELRNLPLMQAILSSCRSDFSTILFRPPFSRNLIPQQHRVSMHCSENKPLKASSYIDIADLLLFSQNPLRYSLKKHLCTPFHCPDRRRLVEQFFEGKKIYPEKFLTQQEQISPLSNNTQVTLREVLSKKAILPLLKEEIHDFIQSNRFDIYASPLQETADWHTPSLLLHPALKICVDGKEIELKGSIQGCHRHGILLHGAASHNTEKIEKWPRMLLQKHVLMTEKSTWIHLPTHDSHECKSDLQLLSEQDISTCLSHLICLYQKAQTTPCLYTPQWIEAVCKNGVALRDLFFNDCHGASHQEGLNAIGISSTQRSLSLLYIAEKKWFDEALTYNFAEEIKGIYTPLFSQKD